MDPLGTLDFTFPLHGSMVLYPYNHNYCVHRIVVIGTGGGGIPGQGHYFLEIIEEAASKPK